MSDEPFRVLLWIEGREEPVVYRMAREQAAAFVARFITADPERAKGILGDDVANVDLTHPTVLRTAFARVFAADALSVGDKRIAPWDLGSSWVIRGSAIQFVQVVDPDEIPPDPPRPKLGFKIDAGLITTPSDDVP